MNISVISSAVESLSYQVICYWAATVDVRKGLQRRFRLLQVSMR